MQSSKIFIGSSKLCSCKCIQPTQQNFNTNHKDNHQIFTQKQLMKKLQKSIIPSVGNQVEQYTELIQSQVKILMEKVKQFQVKCITNLKKILYSSITHDKADISDQMIKIFQKLHDLQYQDLTCQQMYQAFTMIDKNVKEISIQSKLQKIIRTLKPNVQISLHDSFKMILKTQSNASTNSSKNQQKPKQKQVYEESIVNTFKNKSKQQVNDSFSFDQQQSSFSINFYTTTATSSIMESQKKEQSHNQTNQTLIQLLKDQQQQQQKQQMEVFFQPNNKAMVKKKQQEKIDKQKTKNKVQSVQKKKIVIQQFGQSPLKKQSSNTNSKTQQKKPLLQDLNSKKKVSQQQKKKTQSEIQQQKQQIKQQAKPEVKKTQQKVQSLNIAASYVKKQQGKYYIRVAHLQNKQYRQQKATFNIKLKVLQHIMFRFYLDKKSKKVFQKVKFIAGDETGVIVCYTNFLPQIKKGTYIVLNQCELQKYRDLSYQISCHKCKISQEKQQFNVNTQKSISRFYSLKPYLVYSVQKYDAHWPSILGLLYEQSKKSQIIAKMEQIVQQNDLFLYCYLTDGTAKIYTVINKQKCPVFQLGKSYFFKNIKVITEQLYSKQKCHYLQISQKNSPKLIQNMVYDQIDVCNVNTFNDK